MYLQPGKRGKRLKISEVCRILNISRETIRFYEKSGMVVLDKDQQNGYGECSTRAFWDLLNMIGMRNLGFSVRESRQILQEASLKDRIHMYEACCLQLDEGIAKKQYLSRFLHGQVKALKTAALNCGRYWFEFLPDTLWLPMGRSEEMAYSISMEDAKTFGSWSQGHPFVRGALEIETCGASAEEKTEQLLWYYSIEKEYAEYLQLPVSKEVFERPAHLALCTVIDAKGWGEFSKEMLEGFYAEMEKAGIDPKTNRVFGEILCRANEEGQFHRYIRLETKLTDQR